jgi:hypothetical protein
MLRIYVSTETGNDKNDGLSDQSPVRSGRRVIALCKGGNEIVVMGGPAMLRRLSKELKKERKDEKKTKKGKKAKKAKKAKWDTTGVSPGTHTVVTRARSESSS